MSVLNRKAYPYLIIEGNTVSGEITKIQFKRPDNDEMNVPEREYLLVEIKTFFPSTIYNLSPKKDSEDNVLQVLIGLETEERRKRQRENSSVKVIVPKAEVIERLKGW